MSQNAAHQSALLLAHQSSQSSQSSSKDSVYENEELGVPTDPAPPSLWGVPLKYISLVTLAVQNALLAIIMHYSRVSTTPDRAYSAAAAVLMNELLKGGISLVIAYTRVDQPFTPSAGTSLWRPRSILPRFRRLGKEVFSPDCWKLSIPAILYVIQNNLQYVAASNLDAATFQVTYQMKILTTAFFSVLLLRKRLSPAKWLALCFLAAGVAVVQIQSVAGKSEGGQSMQPVKGFMAVTAACFTSGLAGVYFEMVLKNSQADLWVRNVQLSLFSLLPALAAIAFSGEFTLGSGFGAHLFRNFGPWAWATVAIQVFGGLVTALVIKYSDNILKGFATSLSIVISSLASVALFDFRITFSFIIGSTIVLVATMLYSRPEGGTWSDGRKWKWGFCRRRAVLTRSSSPLALSIMRNPSISSVSSSASSSGRNSPVEESMPMLGSVVFDASDVEDDKKDSTSISVGRNLKAVAAALGVGQVSMSRSSLNLPESSAVSEYRTPPVSFYPGTSSQRLPSRAHSTLPSRAPSPAPSAPSSPPMSFPAFSRTPSHLHQSQLSPSNSSPS